VLERKPCELEQQIHALDLLKEKLEEEDLSLDDAKDVILLNLETEENPHGVLGDEFNDLVALHEAG